MFRNTSSHLQFREARGFALVVTLIMLVLAAVIVIALLSNASLDRGTAKSGEDRYQAELATQNGLEAAKKALLASPDFGGTTPPVTQGDGFLVVKGEGPPDSSGNKPSYYFLAKAQAGGNGAIDYYPLFAGGTAQNIATGINPTTYAVTPPTVPTTAFATNPAQETFGTTTRLYPQLLPGQGSAFAQWIEVRDPNDNATAPAHNLPYQRYTFWIEDLAGYVDATIAGNTAGSASGNARPLDKSTAAKRYQTTPGEIALFTLFKPTLSVDPGDTGAKDLIGNRALLFTVPTLRQVAPGPGNTDVTTPVLAARFHADSEAPLVPYGLGYKDEGSLTAPKLQLNAQVTSGGAAAVTAIASKIKNNLPTFDAQRKGGLTGQDYLNTIAASMIDYADTDSDATTGADYRGIDSFPLVSELYSMKWWYKAAYLNASTGTYFVSLEMDTWAELWNTTNLPISGTCTFDMAENLDLQAGVYTYTFGIQQADLQNHSSVVTTYPAGQSFIVTLKANEYGVYHIRKDLFEFNTGIAPPLLPPDPNTTPPRRMNLTGGSKTNYTLKWSGSSGTPSIIVDHAGTQAGVGVNRIGGSMDGYGASSKRWSGTYPGFGYTDSPNGTTTQYDLPGDPRSAYFIQSGQVAVVYDQGSSFWERNNRPNISGNPIYKEVKPSSWPDGGHDSKIIGTAPGANKTTDPPATAPAGVITEETKAPVTISNAGSYSTVAEIGNIFDPGQWNVATNASNQWTDITLATQSSGKYGGGYQLRIGRPEFTLFDKPGTRAWQLLDLFTTTARTNTIGLININTASREALRCLGAAVLLNRDADIQPAALKDTLFPAAVSAQADRFADAVIAARPFLSPAQLSSLKVAGTNDSVFGDPAAWNGATQAAPTEWGDSGKKEYFAKVFPLATVRSRNFRVFVTGQSLDKSGRVTSTLSKVFQVYLNPTRDATGAITAQTVVTSYEAALPF
jgi:hypothetical protein